MGSGERKTIVGENISVEGTICGKENIVVNGVMKGNIELESNQFTVGPTGKVEAEVLADNVIISGTFVGNIKATGKVEITKEANFSGEIKAKRIAVEDGAYLKAVIELYRDSDLKKALGDKPRESKPMAKPATGSNPAMGGSFQQPSPQRIPSGGSKPVSPSGPPKAGPSAPSTLKRS